MKRSQVVAIAVIAAILIIGGILYASRKTAVAPASPSPSAAATATPASDSTSPAAPGSPSSAADSTSATLTYTGSGFTPASVTVKAGGQLTVKNTSTSPMQFDSDPHPVHTDDTDLNIGEIAPGSSSTITVHKQGTFGVHNHLNPSQKAQVTIQ